jgi:hypothetical protein
MAPLKKRRIIDNAFCHSVIPSSAQSILAQALERLDDAGANVASSSIAAAIAAAIEAAGKAPTSLSLRFDASPVSLRIHSNCTARFLCSSRRVTDNHDDEITIIANDSQKEMGEITPTAPRCFALPSTISPGSDHHHCEDPTGMLPGVSSQDAFPWALFEDAARSAVRLHQEIPIIASSDNNRNISESHVGDRHPVARHWHGQSVISHPNGRIAPSSTCLPCLHEAKPSISATTNHEDSKEAYKGDRHPVSRPDTLASLLSTWDKDMASNGTPKGWAYSPANGIRTRNTARDPRDPWYIMASRPSTRQGTRTMNGGADMYAGEFANYTMQEQGVLMQDTRSVMDKGIWWNDERQGETREEELAPGMVQKKKKCNHEGCTKYAQTGGVCCRHGAKRSKSRKYCSHEGCTKFVQRGGFCVRHGAGM